MSSREAKYHQQSFAICWSRDRHLQIVDIYIDEIQYSKGIRLHLSTNEMSSHCIVNLILTRISIKPLEAEVHRDINILKLGYSPEAGTLKFSGSPSQC